MVRSFTSPSKGMSTLYWSLLYCLFYDKYLLHERISTEAVNRTSNSDGWMGHSYKVTNLTLATIYVVQDCCYYIVQFYSRVRPASTENWRTSTVTILMRERYYFYIITTDYSLIRAKHSELVLIIISIQIENFRVLNNS